MASLDICTEIGRLGTFLGWSDQVTLSKPVKPSALAMAKAGFSYTGVGDEVHCFSCGLRVDGWESHHDPVVVHSTRSPHCTLVAGTEAANKPVFVPPEKEYIKIKAMLTELGLRATGGSSVDGPNPSVPGGGSGSLLTDTLTMMYGETMLSSARSLSPMEDRGACGDGAGVTAATSSPLRPSTRPISSSASPSTSHRFPENFTAVSGARSPSQDNDKRSNRLVNQDPTTVTSSPRRSTANSSSTTSSLENPPPSSTAPLRRRNSTSGVEIPVPKTSATNIVPWLSGSPIPARPGFHRAQSCAQPRSKSSRGSDTVANRQTSVPTADHRLYQTSEEARLQTFEAWGGVRGASALEFAQAGFIYIGRPDRVQCVVCHGILKNWNDNDQPIEEHRKHFPDCKFVKDYFARNAAARSGPRHPNFKKVSARRESYSKWSMTGNPTPGQLALAGFFYAGHGDSVKCFHCDGGLRNWEHNDDPWREHARWFPKCGFVKSMKGQAFITEVSSNCAENQSASVDETELKNIAHGAAGSSSTQLRRVDPREVTARMDSPIILSVLKMDVPRKLVKLAIRNHLSKNGEDFTSAEALLEAVYSLDFSSQQGDSSVVDEPQEDATIAAQQEQIDQSGDGNSSKNSYDSTRLMEENRKLKEERQCKICLGEEACITFIACGHLVSCSTCAPALNRCPICRAKIRGTVKTYMS